MPALLETFLSDSQTVAADHPAALVVAEETLVVGEMDRKAAIQSRCR
jgi:hypothetical protein